MLNLQNRRLLCFFIESKSNLQNLEKFHSRLDQHQDPHDK